MSVTPRRSNRLSRNPLVVRNPHPKSTSEAYTWTSDPIYSRPSIRDDFLDDDEWEQALGDDDDEDADGGSTMTDFYDGFRVSGKKSIGKFPRFTRGAKKGRPKNKAKGKEEEQTYKIGDTVLITSVNKLPSVAVIVGMWENRWENENGKETRKMRVKIHWFLRPTELAGIRAKREHFMNEIYYSLNQIEIVYPNDILAHCIVSSIPPADADAAVDAKGTGSSPSTRSLWVYGDELQDDDGTEKYYCHSAINSQRGLFYEFEWEEHQEAALGGDGEVEGDAWDVLVDDDMERRRKGKEKKMNIKAKGPTRSRKRMKKEDKEEDQSETEEFTESEDGGSEDEYASQSDDNEEDDEAGPSDSDSPTADEDSDVPEDVLKTPSKKRKRPTLARTHSKSPSKSTRTPSKRTTTTTTPTTTPRKPAKRRKTVAPTPQSRKSIATRKQKQKSLRVRPPPPLTSHLQLENMPTDPWLRAMHVLHVGARPDVLPCREEEYARCLRAVEELVEEGSGGCVYISGVPGTGKTATVHAIVRELKRMAEETETNPFTYVEINGLKIPDPTAAYSLLWEAVSGHDVANEGHMKISAKESLKCLSRHFNAGGTGASAGPRGRGRGGARGRGGPGGHACVVLMDELDQLVTTKQDVVYNFFNWPTLVGSKLIVLAVANTMDLPERVMSGRVRSRLGMIRINFQPYTTPQLEKIVQTRLQGAKDGLEGKDKEQVVISPDGIKFAAMKVSSISGDARRVLDICRRTVELVQPLKRTAKTDDVKEVIKVMQNSPTAAYLRDCSLHERMMLAALLKVIKREGVEEVRWGDVQHQHLIYMNVLTGADDPMRKPTPGELNMVLESLAASRAMLIEDGLAASRKAEGDRKVILNLEQGEVERTLSGFGSRWKNALSG